MKGPTLATRVNALKSRDKKKEKKASRNKTLAKSRIIIMTKKSIIQILTLIYQKTIYGIGGLHINNPS